MSNQYAENFFDILNVLAANRNLRQGVITLIKNEPMPGKILEDNNGKRLEIFRDILTDLVNGVISLTEAYQRTEDELPRHTSPHSSNNRVFAKGWSERLVRIQLSRFYNQAVLEQLQSKSIDICFVPHSVEEDTSSACTQQLAGKQHQVAMLYDHLIEAYQKGIWSKEVKIPNHPHCTHVVRPPLEHD